MHCVESSDYPVALWRATGSSAHVEEMTVLADKRGYEIKGNTLVKKGKPCGTMFNVEGPRLLRTSAVWAADEGRILFYDSTGQRALEVKLGESPEVVL